MDGRFSISILEHWTRVFRGKSAMPSPNFFFPERDVLGYSDAFFLMAIPFSLLRAAGADRYLAFQITVMLLTVIGFACMLYLFRRVIGFARPTSLLGASLLIVFNMYYIHIVHPQLAAVVFVPLLLVLLGRYWQTRHTKPIQACVYICSAGFLWALVLFTSFYIGWFTLLFCATGLLFFAASTVAASRSMQPIRTIGAELWKQRSSLLLGLLAFLVGLIPFLIVYLPAMRHTGTRDLPGTLYYMPSPLGVFDVGRDNVVWGFMARRIEALIAPGGLHEHPTGWPLFTVCLFLGTFFSTAIQIIRPSRDGNSQSSYRICSVLALSVTCVTLWLAGTRFGHHAPLWAVLWRFVPGASAIRVPPRIDLVLNVGVVIVCMFGFERMIQAVGRPRLRRAPVGFLLASVLITEQLNLMPTHLISRSAEFRKFAKIPSPPHGCREFYISDLSTSRFAILASQTDAMLLAQQFNLPTFNGYSGWFPSGWQFLLPASRATNAERAREWAQAHQISSGLCSLNISSGAWLPIDLSASPSSSQLLEDAVGNPGFENQNLLPWQPFGTVVASITSARSHSGAHSLAETAGSGSVYADLDALDLGVTYVVSAWVAGAPGTTATAQIAIFDPSTNTAIYSTPLHPSPDWQLVRESVTAGNAGTVRIHLLRNPGKGTVYWDDVRIYVDK